MTEPVINKVGSAVVTDGDRINCEVCQATYHATPGSKNDCPLCNAPSGKGINITVGASLAGNVLAPQVEALAKTVGQLQVRVAELEAKVAHHSEILKAGN
jgi:mRNA-degrading endonuclease toxin of MazEF toxin-antitoxin module